jgi:hypothetical protein
VGTGGPDQFGGDINVDLGRGNIDPSSIERAARIAFEERHTGDRKVQHPHSASCQYGSESGLLAAA